jgi:hypothetical protein
VSHTSSSGRQRREHWDAAYAGRSVTAVSWYQATPTVSLELIERLCVPPSETIVDIGGGASLLVDALLARGFSDVSVLDISSVALDEVRRRTEGRPGAEGRPVTLIHDDVLHWRPTRPVGVWHDRAVLHFLTEPAQRDRYLATMRSALGPGGAVIMATFAPDGPEYCSGLPVARYGTSELASLIGADFEVVAQRREEHVTPAGVVQPFSWVAARRRERDRSVAT